VLPFREEVLDEGKVQGVTIVVCDVTQKCIIESVDSVCRDSADTQYMLIQTNFSKSPKQLTYKPL